MIPARLTPAQRREYRSLREDGGYTRAEAEAWVRGFPPPDAERPPCGAGPSCRCAEHVQARIDREDRHG